MTQPHNEESPLLVDKLTDKDERHHDEMLCRAGILFMLATLAMVVPVSIYFSLVGWFGNLFQSRTLFTFMVLCVFFGGTPTMFLQIVLDTRYTKGFGSQHAYNFRICVSLGVLAVCSIFLPFCSATWQVLCLGVAVGAFARAGLSSAVQLASAVDPSLNRYVLFGPAVANAMPIVLTFVLAFASDSPRSIAVVYCAIPAAITFVVAVCFLLAAFLYFHGSSQFRTAYQRLHEAAERQEMNTASTCHMDIWLPATSIIGCSYVRHVALWFIDTVAMPFVTFAGSYDFAAQLILVNFGAQIVGSLFAIFIPSLLGPAGSTPRSLTHLPAGALAVIVFLQAVFLVPYFAKVYGWMDLGAHAEAVILITFGISYIMGRIAAAENSVAALQAADPKQALFVSRAFQLLNACTQLVATLFAWVVIELSGLSK